jgi:hypothetical protein
VQTEDKGLATPLILSLVYDRGTILASRRVPYDDIIESGFEEAVLAERLQKQHNLICAAVRAGRIEDLKKMTADARPKRTAGGSKRKKKPARAQSPATASVATVESILETIPGIPRPSGPTFEADAARPIPRPRFDLPLPPPIKTPTIEPLLEDGIEIVEDDLVHVDAVEFMSDLVGKARPTNNKLSLEFLGTTQFRSGEKRTISIMVCRGSHRKVVPDAQVMIKVLGSSFRPMIFHALTDDNGLAKLHMQFPAFKAGRATIMVRALSDGEEVEVRESIMQ